MRVYPRPFVPQVNTGNISIKPKQFEALQQLANQMDLAIEVQNPSRTKSRYYAANDLKVLMHNRNQDYLVVKLGREIHS